MSVVTIGVPGGRRDDIHRTSLGDNGPFPHADTYVLLIDAGGFQPALFSRRQVDFAQAIQRGARLVFAFGPTWSEQTGGGILPWLFQRIRIEMESLSSMEIRSRVPELRTFFENQRAHACVVLGAAEESYEGLQVLGEAVQDRSDIPFGRASLRFQEGQAEIIFVPLLGVPANTEDILLDFLDRLPLRQEYPEYLDVIELQNESGLLVELDQLEDRRKEIQAALFSARRTKQILFFTELDLEHEVVRFLREELRIAVRHVPGSDEDFRLVDDETGEDWGVGEVKGYARKNVPRPDILLVEIHRNEAGFSEDAPALLVANTFHAAQRMAEREEPIAPNVIKTAHEDHVLIVRTLDLIRLKQLEIASRPKTEDFVQAIRDGGGWFEVDADLKVRLHP